MSLSIKGFIILGLSIFLNGSIYAQFSDVQKETEKQNLSKKGKLEYGFEHTLSFSSLVGVGPKTSFGVVETELVPAAFKFTMGLGGFGNYFFTDKLSLQFEFLFAFYGGNFRLESTIYQDLGYFKSNTKKGYALRYFKLPLTLNYTVSNGFYLQGGGYFSTMLSAKTYESAVVFDTDIEFVDDLNLIDVGLIGGVGFKTKVVNIGFRYNYGLSNVFSNYEPANLHNSVFELIAHWKFNHKDKK